ncbi:MULTISPECIES: hypothetical protein [unclassified Thiocapsa]|uniref:hypothetical protein n=1 Tax=unclassified Thiocapsa TaxID=2641286 RepID=UPI0035AF1D8A
MPSSIAKGECSQDVLDHLVKDRPEPTSEIFRPNAWYGSARILKNFAKWPLPLPVVVPHGVYLDDFLWDAEITNGLPAIYCFEAHRTEIYRARSDKEIVAGCSPWMYLLRCRESNVRMKVGTVAFPPHSTQHLESRLSDEARYMATLQSLPSWMRPVRVCLYWRDIQLGRHEAYRSAGFEVVTAGHMFDGLFFDRLYEIMDGSEYLHTTVVGSHIFYGAAKGLKIVLDSSFEHEVVADESILRRDCPPLDPSRRLMNLIEKARSIYGAGDDVEHQKAFAIEILGGNNWQSPREMRRLFFRLYLQSRALRAAVIRLALHSLGASMRRRACAPLFPPER